MTFKIPRRGAMILPSVAFTHNLLTTMPLTTGAIAQPVRLREPADSPPVETRNYYDNPGGNDSIWVTPLGDGAVWGSLSDPDTQVVMLGIGVNTDWFGQAVWVGGPNDPVIRCSGTDWYGKTVRANIHIPIGAYPVRPPPPTGDSQITLFDTTQPYKMWCYGTAVVSKGHQNGVQRGDSISGGLSQVDDASSDHFGEDQETGLSGNNCGIGVISVFDLDPVRNPSRKIQHMLRYLCDSHKMNPGAGGRHTQVLGPEAWPSRLQDFGAWTPGAFNAYDAPAGHGLLPGVTIGIPQNVPVPSGLTPGGQMLFTCLQEFGAIFADVAPGSGGIQYHSDAKLAGNPLIAGMNRDIAVIQRQVRPLRNQHKGGQSFAMHPKNGPGKRVASPPPPLKKI
jgi:hypothetical protein